MLKNQIEYRWQSNMWIIPLDRVISREFLKNIQEIGNEVTPFLIPKVGQNWSAATLVVEVKISFCQQIN